MTRLTATAVTVPSTPTSSSRKKYDTAIPVILRPLVRAYLLGYASAVGPRLLTLLLQHLTRWKRGSAKRLSPKGEGEGEKQSHQRKEDPFLQSLRHILRGGLDPRRFPTFCAAIVGGSTLLQVSSCYPLSFWPTSTTAPYSLSEMDTCSRATSRLR